MYLSIDGDKTYVATGSKQFDTRLPTVVFLHGSALDHQCWIQHAQWFSSNGYAVLAPDLPAHGLSEGIPLESIEEIANWLWQLLDNAGVGQCHLVGHSQGALVAMQAASLQPERCRSISIIASSAAIPVNKQLLSMAQNDLNQAITAMLTWGFSEAYQADSSAQPQIKASKHIMLGNPLFTDLSACNHYHQGDSIAATLNQPSQLILAKQDRMTPLKAGRALADRLPNVQSLVELDAGHMLPIEAPNRCLDALRQFISTSCKALS